MISDYSAKKFERIVNKFVGIEEQKRYSLMRIRDTAEEKAAQVGATLNNPVQLQKQSALSPLKSLFGNKGNKASLESFMKSMGGDKNSRMAKPSKPIATSKISKKMGLISREPGGKEYCRSAQ